MALPQDSAYVRYAPTRPAWPHHPPLVRRRSARTNFLLFFLTLLTTTLSGAIFSGGVADPIFLLIHPSLLWTGVPFSFTLMAILLCHELGHYTFARAYGVDATLPFFVPGPPLPPLPGTFGAFIVMRSLSPHRRALYDIGAAGPWAGIAIAIPAIAVGLHLSEVLPVAGAPGLVFGEPLLFRWLVQLVLGVDSQKVTVFLHPVALAGWFGLFVTMLNLLPIGQLDGGHVSYAVFGRHHRWVSLGALTFLIVLGAQGWLGWVVFAVLISAVGIRHPPPVDPALPLGRARLIGAALTLLLLIVTFMPEPFAQEVVVPPQFEGERVPI